MMTDNPIQADDISARSQLNDIMVAINRERLALEDWQKRVDEKKKEANELEAKNEELKKAVVTAGNNFEDFKVRVGKATDELNAQKQKASDDLGVLKVTTQKEIEAQDAYKASIQKKIDEQLAEAEQARKLVKDNTDVLSTNLEQVKAELSSKRDSVGKVEIEHARLSAEVKSFGDTLAAKKKEFDDLVAGVGAKNKELEIINADIKSKTEEQATLSAHLELLRGTHDEQVKISASLAADILAQQSEKDGFIKAKIDLKQAQDDLVNREAFIKEKYRVAGINF